MGCKILNVLTDVNACGCTQGCMDTVRESALKVDSGRKIPCRIGESNLRQRRAGPMLYQLSYKHLHPYILVGEKAYHQCKKTAPIKSKPKNMGYTSGAKLLTY